MFEEVKAMLPISGDDYDAEIITQIKAAALDLTRTSEIVMPGEIRISRVWEETDNPYYDPDDPESGLARVMAWVVHDNSDVTDELIITAIATWCNMRIGNPPNYDALLKAYESMKGSMRLSRYYNTEADAE